MAHHDRKPARGTDWFIDFEQGDHHVEAIRQGRHGPRQPGPGTPKNDAQPKTAGPSPWVTDFLLNHVEGARIEPAAVRRKPVRGKGEGASTRSRPAKRELPGSGAVEAHRPVTTAGRVANGRARDPKAIPRGASPPSTTVKARTGGWRARPYMLAATLGLVSAGVLLTLPEGNWRNTLPDESTTRSAQAVPRTQLPDSPKSKESWRDLPVQAAAVLQPVGINPVRDPTLATTVGVGGPAEVASLVGPPAIASLAPAPAHVEISSTHIRTARVLRPPRPTPSSDGAAVEVTARDADAERAVAAGPGPDEGRRDLRASGWVEPAPATSATEPPSSEATALGNEGAKSAPEGRSIRMARRHERRRHAGRQRPSRVAQASQGRSLTLPAVLRPTSF